MDRYQFEDAVSAYLDNELNLSRRKEFEDYLAANADTKEFVADIKNTIESLGKMSKIQISSSFMTNLYSSINLKKSRTIQKREKNTNTIFGFTPLYAGFLSVLIIAFIGIGLNTITNYGDTVPGMEYSKQDELFPDYKGNSGNINPDVLAITESDTTDSLNEIHQKKYNLQDRIRLVKDR